MRRIRVRTILTLLVIAASVAACVHTTAVELKSTPLVAQQTLSPPCVPTAPMPIIGLKLGAPKPLPPSREYNTPVIQLSACYLAAERNSAIRRLVPSRDTSPSPHNQK